VELSARYINDRKLPDKAIDVIDEAGAAQMLAAASRAQEDDRPRGDRGRSSPTMARIPPKIGLERRRGSARRPRPRPQARGVRPGRGHRRAGSRDQAGARRPARSGKAHRLLPVQRARPASARPKWRGSWPRSWASSCMRFDMSRIHGAAHRIAPDRRAAGLCRLRPGRPADRCASTSTRTACCCSTRSRRRTRICSTSCCR